MSFIEIGIISTIILLLLLLLGLPVAANFFIVGFFGLTAIIGFNRAVSILGQSLYHTVATPTWAALPLFILMGALATQGGFAKKAYQGLNKFTSGLPGALGIATCMACAAFGVISGSAAATAAIFGKLAFPEMQRYGYDKAFAVGTIASAGTFAAMIPPSGLMIVYCLLTEQSIGRLFAAGFIPGIITAIVYSVSIIYRAKNNPKLIKKPLDNDIEYETGIRMKERIMALFDMWPVLIVAALVLGGIYSGNFTPTEAAAVGCISIFFLGLLQGYFRRKEDIVESLKQSASTTSMLFIIIIGALFFSRYIAYTRIPTRLTSWLLALDIPNVVILVGVLFIWFLLGMIIIPDAIYALTVPLMFPIIINLGYDPIWFGIITIKLSEIANVTPPVGLNLFTIQGSIGKSIKIHEIYEGIWPFVLCDLIVLIFLILFPQITLWLPNLLFG